MLSMAICDDETFCRQQIIDCTKQLPLPELSIHEFEDGEDLISAYREGKRFHILMLDVEMPHISGMETARQIRFIDRDAVIIFITSHENYVYDAFTVQAFQYLLKPVRPELLKQQLTKAIAHYYELHAVYMVQSKAAQVSLNIHRIRFLEKQGHTLIVYSEEGTFQCSGKLDEEEKRLSPYGFIRCHRSYLVNPRHIRVIDETGIQMRTGERVPVAQKKRTSVKEQFQIYLLRYKL